MVQKRTDIDFKVFIGNPTEEQYRFFGYTDKIIEDIAPEEKEGMYIEEYYEQIENVIYKRYREVEITEGEI